MKPGFLNGLIMGGGFGGIFSAAAANGIYVGDEGMGWALTGHIPTLGLTISYVKDALFDAEHNAFMAKEKCDVTYDDVLSTSLKTYFAATAITAALSLAYFQSDTLFSANEIAEDNTRYVQLETPDF